MNQTTETSRGPDGRFASPTPSLPDAIAADTAPVVVADAPQVDAPAPDASPRDVARATFERIVSERTAKDGDGTDGASPPDHEKTAGGGTPNPAPADKTKSEKPYAAYGDSLDERTANALKGVNMLLPPDEWRAMSRFEQDEHVQAAKDLRRQAQAAAASKDRAAAPTQTNQGHQLDPAARGERPVSGQKREGVALPQRIVDSLAKVAEEYGPDSSVYAAQLAIAEESLGSLHNVQAGFQHQQAQAQLEARTRELEDTVLRKYADYPTLKDPKQVELLRMHARATYDSYRRTGSEATPEQVIDLVVRSAIAPEIQQHQADQKAKRREQSLAGSVQRGAAGNGKPQAQDPRAKAREIWERVSRPAAVA